MCCRLEEIFKFPAYIDLISVDSVIMVSHSPDHPKLRKSDKRT